VNDVRSEQSEQPGVRARQVQEAAGELRGSLRTHQIPRQHDDQAIPGAARPTVRLRLQTRSVRPATKQPAAGFHNAVRLTVDAHCLNGFHPKQCTGFPQVFYS